MHRNRLLTLVVAAIAAHAVFLAVTAQHAIPTSQDHYDARQYRELADSIAGGHGFQLTRGGALAPDLDRTPLYPLFVALFGTGWDRVPAVLIAQHAIVILTALLTAWWARRRVGSDLAATVAFVIVAFDLTTMTYASYLLTESLFTLLLTTALVTWPIGKDSRATSRSVAAGAAWGLATLTRPITFYLAPLAILLSVLAWRTRPAAPRRAAIAFLVGALVTGVWMARNYAISGSAVLSTIEGENILHYRAALVSLPPGKSVEDWRKELRTATNEGSYDRTDPRQAAALDQAKKKKAIELIASHPLGLYRPFTIGLPRLFVSPNRTYLYKLLGIEHVEWDLNTPDGPSLADKLFTREALYLGASVVYQLLLLITAGAGAIVAARRRETWAVVPVVALAYLTIFSSGLETHARFRVPLVPILAILSARAVWATVDAKGRSSDAALAPSPGSR